MLNCYLLCAQLCLNNISDKINESFNFTLQVNPTKLQDNKIETNYKHEGDVFNTTRSYQRAKSFLDQVIFGDQQDY